mgnify:CR=1 FL=1
MIKKSNQPPPKYPFTQEGYEKIKQEYEDLLNSRPEVLDHLKKAREMGDLSENGYYKSYKFKLISLDVRLRKLSYLLKHKEIIQSPDNQTVHLGNTVTISNDNTQTQYTIVGPFESHPAENKISNKSPLGQTLLGKKPGETIQVQTPTQITTYKIIKIQ